jgi:deoxyribodipyrimidine photo-lyase
VSGLVWFRKDLRLADNPAWAEATAAHDGVQALFVVEPSLWEAAGPLRARQLAANLRSLDEDLGRAGGRLLVVTGPAERAVPEVAGDYDAVYWNADYSPFAARRDDAVAAALAVPVTAAHGTMIHPPGSVTTDAGEPYRVFTPFWKRWAATPWEPWPEAGTATIESRAGDGIPDAGGPPPYEPGETGARNRLDRFCEVVDAYGDDRNRPDVDGTSRLSIDLKFGTISPRRVVDDVGEDTPGRAGFVRQLAWREFHAHALAAFPHGFRRSLQPQYDLVRWRTDPTGFDAWAAGLTGFPLVDAGMRQLLAEGWMHNRVRLVTASFLVKDLLVDWRLGERHFRRLLVDADPAQNVGNWQWVASTGFDAAPYFRIMNPISQSARHDPDGSYIRRWVPELAPVPNAAIHAPWEHREVVAAAGVVLGEDYPLPLLEHKESRERTLEAFAAARAASGS